MAVPLTSILEIESALGRDLSTAEEGRATYYINAISAFIASYCDLVAFEEVTDDTIRLQADYYGIIELGGGPISSVATVTDVDGTEAVGWAFDGSSMITGLEPFQTVDVVYTHGKDTIPEDLVALATDAVIGCIALQVSGPLKTRTVGDVTYAFQEGTSVGVTLQESVLDRYRTTEFTFRTGPTTARAIDYPINWFQVGR